MRGGVIDAEPGGRLSPGELLVVGFVSGRIPEIGVSIPLIKGFNRRRTRGEYTRRFPERGRRLAHAIDRLAREKRIAHIDRILLPSDWREAFKAMDRGEILGKTVLIA